MTTNVGALLDTLIHANRLKWLPRSGWQLRGVDQPESIADHTYGVTFIAMLLADLGAPSVDRERVLRIALLHDLAESLVTDLPATLARFLPPEVKHAAERAALTEILAALDAPDEYLALWEEYNTGQIPEAQLVRDADKLEMMLQAFVYEQRGQRNLDDFWSSHSERTFATPLAAEIFRALRRRRQALYDGPSAE